MDIPKVLTNKELKEQFVSGCTGSTILDVSSVILVSVLVFPVSGVICRFLRTGYWTTALIDCLIIGISVLLSQTLLADYTVEMNVTCITILVALKFFHSLNTSKKVTKLDKPSLFPFLTSARSMLMVLVLVSILAVDFHVFPRRFVKVETFGSSLMDVGVGSFVFARGFVAGNPNKKSKKKSFIGRIIPVLFLGLVRYVSVVSTDYQEHITEYGKHWNFFFTLAFVDLFAQSAVVCLNSTKFLALSGVLILIVHQYCLSNGLTDYIMNHPRDNLISSNREGIVGVFSYTGLYLIALYFGEITMTSFRSENKTRLRDIFGIFILCCLLWTLTSTTDHFVQRISRRMSNLPFCVWVLAINETLYLIIGCFHVIFPELDAHVTENSGSIIFSINRNSLFMFLLGNLGTGFVNFTFDTFHADTTKSMIILTVYVILIFLASSFFGRFDIPYL